MLDLFWNLHQHGQIRSAQDAADRAKSEARNSSAKIHELENAVDRLLLINRAMWELMQERLELNDAQLAQKVNEIDLRDGKLDGKITAHVQLRCPACGRDQHSRHARCLYCGAALSGGDVFDSVK